MEVLTSYSLMSSLIFLLTYYREHYEREHVSEGLVASSAAWGGSLRRRESSKKQKAGRVVAGATGRDG